MKRIACGEGRWALDFRVSWRDRWTEDFTFDVYLCGVRVSAGNYVKRSIGGKYRVEHSTFPEELRGDVLAHVVRRLAHGRRCCGFDLTLSESEVRTLC